MTDDWLLPAPTTDEIAGLLGDPATWPTLEGRRLNAVRGLLHESAHACTARSLEEGPLMGDAPNVESVVVFGFSTGACRWTRSGVEDPTKEGAVLLAGFAFDFLAGFPHPGEGSEHDVREASSVAAAHPFETSIDAMLELAVRTLNDRWMGVVHFAATLLPVEPKRLVGAELTEALDRAMVTADRSHWSASRRIAAKRWDEKALAFVRRQRELFEASIPRIEGVDLFGYWRAAAEQAKRETGYMGGMAQYTDRDVALSPRRPTVALDDPFWSRDAVMERLHTLGAREDATTEGGTAA